MYHDNYVQTKPNYKDPSMISISFRMGALAVVIAYLIGGAYGDGNGAFER